MYRPYQSKAMHLYRIVDLNLAQTFLHRIATLTQLFHLTQQRIRDLAVRVQSRVLRSIARYIESAFHRPVITGLIAVHTAPGWTC